MKQHTNNHPLYNYRFYMLVVGVLSICLCSCNKYLDKQSSSAITVPDSLSDLQALLDNAAKMNQQITPSYGEASSDNCFVSGTSYNALSVQYQQAYVWDLLPEGSATDWGSCYAPVYTANLVLDQLKAVPLTGTNETVWDNVKGSALFFRSYYFLWLLWDYANAYDSATANKDLGIALRLTSNFNVTSTRATNQQCYQQVISDTKSAIALLPQYPQHVFRPSKGAAYGLLARCYLSMRDYGNALLYADSALQSNGQLMDFNTAGTFNGSINAGYPFKQFNPETIFYTEMNLNFSTLTMTVLTPRIDTVLHGSYESTDLRLAAYYGVANDGYPTFRGSYCGSYYLFTGIATDEMYLIRAECYVRENEVQKGLNDLDKLLMNRYATGTFQPLSITNQQTALDTILLERRKELVERGLRWPDIKRLNKEENNIVLRRLINGQSYTLEPNTEYYALPIPEDIIQMTGMPQN